MIMRTIWWQIASVGSACAISVLMISMVTHAQGQQGGLRPDEYDPVGLIYDDVLSVLGDRALYPVCIDVRTDTPVHQLLRYLRSTARS